MSNKFNLYQITKEVREEYKKFEVEVDLQCRKGISSRVFPKLCFKKSLEYIIEHSSIPNIVLVHGFYEECETHAWVEFDNIVFDGVFQRFYYKDLYYQERKMRKIMVYTRDEALENLHRSNHSGPWED